MTWADNNYQYKKKITIDHTLVAGDEVDFPVVIVRTDNNLTACKANGFDIKFYNLLGQPRIVFETLGLLIVIKTYTDRKEALEAFHKPLDSEDEQSLQEGLEESAAEGRFALSLFQASLPTTETLSHRPAFHFALLPGESAFHRLDCELLAGRTDREKILLRSDNKLDLLGLTPCRTCIRKGPSGKELP